MRRRPPDRKGRGCAGCDVQPKQLVRGYQTPEPCVAAPIARMSGTALQCKSHAEKFIAHHTRRAGCNQFGGIGAVAPST